MWLLKFLVQGNISYKTMYGNSINFPQLEINTTLGHSTNSCQRVQWGTSKTECCVGSDV